MMLAGLSSNIFITNHKSFFVSILWLENECPLTKILHSSWQFIVIQTMFLDQIVTYQNIALYTNKIKLDWCILERNICSSTNTPALWHIKQIGLFKIRTSVRKSLSYKNICDQLLLLYVFACLDNDVADKEK